MRLLRSVIASEAVACVIARNEVTKQSIKRLLRFARNDTSSSLLTFDTQRRRTDA